MPYNVCTVLLAASVAAARPISTMYAVLTYIPVYTPSAMDPHVSLPTSSNVPTAAIMIYVQISPMFSSPKPSVLSCLATSAFMPISFALISVRHSFPNLWSSFTSLQHQCLWVPTLLFSRASGHCFAQAPFASLRGARQTCQRTRCWQRLRLRIELVLVKRRYGGGQALLTGRHSAAQRLGCECWPHS